MLLLLIIVQDCVEPMVKSWVLITESPGLKTEALGLITESLDLITESK